MILNKIMSSKKINEDVMKIYNSMSKKDRKLLDAAIVHSAMTSFQTSPKDVTDMVGALFLFEYSLEGTKFWNDLCLKYSKNGKGTKTK